MSDIRKKLTNPDRAAAGALLQRQSATMNGLLNESDAAYESAREDGLLKGDIGKNTPDNQYMGRDAFRHAYASARATQAFGPEVANFLGRGNEWLAAATRENDDKNTNAADIGMDLHNNKVGREIAKQLGDKATPMQLRDAVVAAADKGDLILSNKDPRALKAYDSQYDMKALAAAYDGVKTASAVAKEGYQAAVEKTTEFFAKADSAVRSAASRLEGLKASLKTAMESDGSSPMFMFTEKQLQEGEKFADKVKPEVVSAVESTVEYGRQLAVSSERLQDLMAPVSQFAAAETEQSREFSQEHSRVAMAERDREEGRNREPEAAREMEMDVA